VRGEERGKRQREGEKSKKDSGIWRGIKEKGDRRGKR
jgi:hypothetical protein